MRVLGTTLVVVAALAALAAGAPPSVAQLPPVGGDPVRDILDELPPLPVEPPPLPELPLPDLPLPTPVPAPAPPAVAVPTPAPTRAPATAAATPAPAPAAPRGERARPGRPSRSAERAAAPALVSRPARRRDRGSAAPARPRPAAAPGVAAPPAGSRPAAARERAARGAGTAGPPSFASRVTDDVGEIIRSVPPALLWALGGIAAIAIGLAVNAYWQSRRRVALEAQRAELLDDIGLLSRALLPAMPAKLDGLAVSAAYRPADGPAAGGDFYDVFTIGEQRICVLLGDVSGHGRESVTQAALARYTLRTLLAAGHRPAEALARADVLLARDLRPDFVTVIACVYDPATGELTYAKAGHAPPIVLGTAHDPDAEEPAPPIGLGVGETWPEYRVQLGDGVSVCLFTDGLEDARVGDVRIGRAEVARMLAAHDVPDAGRLLGDLEGLADRVSDDTAAVVLSRR
jgi:hypothetical protein